MNRWPATLGGAAVLLALRSLLAPSVVRALPIAFDHFHTPAEVNQILLDLQAAFPQLCLVDTLGTTYEGRSIPVIKISDEVTKDDPFEDDVVFVALQHSREWITVEMALYLAEQLLTRHGSDPGITADVDSLEIWIVPVANPDGFAFTHAEDGDENWRKNRQPSAATANAIGVDLNRNYGFPWLDSKVPTADTYPGVKAFSELETRALRDFLAGLDHLEVIVDYHSWGARFLRPWAFGAVDPPAVELLFQVQQRGLTELAQPPGPNWLGAHQSWVAGVLQDWAWNLHRIVPMTVELPPGVCVDDCIPPSKPSENYRPPADEVVASNVESLPVAFALIHDAAGPEVRLRDHAADTGDEPSAAWLGSHWSQPFWKSPDIRTSLQTWTAGTQVTIEIDVHNDASQPRTGVQVDAYYAEPQIALEVPGPSTKLIGTAVVDIPATSSQTVTLPWTVPLLPNSQGAHDWSIGVVVSHPRDLPLTPRPESSSNVALRGIVTASLAAGGGTLVVGITNTLDVLAGVVAEVPPESLPPGWRARFPSLEQQTTPSPSTPEERKASLLGVTGRPLLEPGKTLLLPLRVEPPADWRETGANGLVDIDVHGALLPIVAGPRRPVGGGITYRLTILP